MSSSPQDGASYPAPYLRPGATQHADAPSPTRHPSQDAASPRRGFFAAFFDLKFESYVTDRAVPVLWGFLVTIHIAAAIFVIVLAFRETGGPIVGAISVVVAPFVAFLILLLWRLVLEFLVTQFRSTNSSN